MATYDNEVVLLKQNYVQDNLGQWIPSGDPERTELLCNKKSVGRTEFYNASVAGMEPELILGLHAYEYDNQKQVEFNGQTFDVIRTYQVNFEEIELTVGKKIGNG